MENCIFCKIVKGEIDSAKIWEDGDVLVFLDVKPFTKGHALVIPKQHFENIFDIDENVLQKTIVVAKNIAQTLKKSLPAPAVNLMNSSGGEAGQEVMHFHLHVIPRSENDGISFHQESHQKLSFEELKTLAKEISEKL